MKNTRNKLLCQLKSLLNELFLHYMQCDEKFKHFIAPTNGVLTEEKAVLQNLPTKSKYTFAEQYTKNSTFCSHAVPRVTANSGAMHDKKEKKQAEWRKELKQFEEWADTESGLGLTALRNCASLILNNTIKIFQKFADGSFRVFSGAQKGTPFYNNRLKGITMHKCAQLANKSKHIYFLTLTYSVSKWGKERIKAWENFNEHITPILRFLRDKYGAIYVWTLESTGKQYPHAHILIGTQEELDMGGKTKVWQDTAKDCQIGKELAERVFSPVFCLEKAKNHKVAGYIAKYIAKDTATELRKVIPKKDKKARKEQIKSLSTMLFPVLAGCRQVGYSKNIEKMADLPEVIYKQKDDKVLKKENNPVMADSAQTAAQTAPNFDVDWDKCVEWFNNEYEWDNAKLTRAMAMIHHFHTVLDKGEITPAERAQLDTLLIKSTMNCCSEIRTGKGKKLIDIVGDEDKDFTADNVIVWEKIKLYTERKGCWGCPLMRFALYRQGYNVETFDNGAFIKEDGTANTDLMLTLDARPWRKKRTPLKQYEWWNIKLEELEVMLNSLRGNPDYTQYFDSEEDMNEDLRIRQEEAIEELRKAWVIYSTHSQ